MPHCARYGSFSRNVKVVLAQKPTLQFQKCEVRGAPAQEPYGFKLVAMRMKKALLPQTSGFVLPILLPSPIDLLQGLDQPPNL